MCDAVQELSCCHQKHMKENFSAAEDRFADDVMINFVSLWKYWIGLFSHAPKTRFHSYYTGTNRNFLAAFTDCLVLPHLLQGVLPKVEGFWHHWNQQRPWHPHLNTQTAADFLLNPDCNYQFHAFITVTWYHASLTVNDHIVETLKTSFLTVNAKIHWSHFTNAWAVSWWRLCELHLCYFWYQWAHWRGKFCCKRSRLQDLLEFPASFESLLDVIVKMTGFHLVWRKWALPERQKFAMLGNGQCERLSSSTRDILRAKLSPPTVQSLQMWRNKRVPGRKCHHRKH